MNWWLILEVLLIAIIVCAAIIITAHILTKKILIYYNQMKQPIAPKDVLEYITYLIDSEFSIYEKDLFTTQGNVLDSGTFDNYYNTLCYTILDDLSPEFIERAKYTMTDKQIADLISRAVRSYLSTKIASGGLIAPAKQQESL